MSKHAMTRFPSEDIKNVVDTLCSIFEEGCIDLSSLEYILQKLKTKYPEDPSLATALKKYSELLKKLKECFATIENGKESAALEKELEDILGCHCPEIYDMERLKRWVAFKNRNFIKSIKNGDQKNNDKKFS